jgi:hypothetical protein
VSTLDYDDEERDVLLSALFELWLTRSAFDDDPEAARIPFARIRHNDIDALVAKLGGDKDTAMFGAYRDEWADVDGPVPEYPADESDEG